MYKRKVGGIYKIEHRSGYYYIGMSVDIFTRWQSHYSDIKNLKHSSTDFMLLWNSTSPHDWSFYILEYISITDYKIVSKTRGKQAQAGFRSELLKKEKLWMSKFSINWALNKNKKWFT